MLNDETFDALNFNDSAIEFTVFKYDLYLTKKCYYNYS